MDRPDLITRVFKLKLQSLLEDILKNGYLGQPAAHMYVVDFFKREVYRMSTFWSFSPMDITYSHLWINTMSSVQRLQTRMRTLSNMTS